MFLASFSKVISQYLLLSFVVLIPLFATIRGYKAFDSFVEGARGSFDLMITVFPFLLGMIVAVKMLIASGLIVILGDILSPILSFFGVDVDLLQIMLTKPISGSASNAAFVDVLDRNHPDSLTAQTAAVIMGSSETTYYIAAVYLGAVAIRRSRYAL